MASDFPTADDDPICERCGMDYYLRDGCDPTPYCDQCAHAAVAELRAERDRLRGAGKPFAVYANAVSDGWPDSTGASLSFTQPDGSMNHDPRITLGDCRRMAELLKDAEPKR